MTSSFYLRLSRRLGNLNGMLSRPALACWDKLGLGIWESHCRIHSQRHGSYFERGSKYDADTRPMGAESFSHKEFRGKKIRLIIVQMLTLNCSLNLLFQRNR